MIVKKYIANTVEEAQALISQELGPKAITLTLRYVKQKGWKALFTANRVEVTAAIEEADLKSHNQSIKAQIQEPAKTTSTTDLSGNLSDLKKLLEQEASDVTPIQEEESLNRAPKPRMNGTYSDPRFRTKRDNSEPISSQEHERALRKLEALRRGTPPQKSPEKDSSADFNSLREGLVGRFGSSGEKEEVTEAASQLVNLRQLAQSEKAVAEARPSGEAKFLMAKGIDREIASTIEKRVSALDKETRIRGVKSELSNRIQTAGPITLKERPTIVAIVGPTGVGKTTTLAKIAGQYSGQLGKKVAVISLDTVKVGAREQIKGLCGQAGYPCAVASSAFELQEAIGAFGDQDLILIDTAGQGQYHHQNIDALAEILSSVEGIQTLLVLSATTKDIDAYGSVLRYEPVHIDSLIFTKLDETIAHGIIVNVCQKTGKAVRYLTQGMRIPEDLAVADSDQIARAILVRNNAKEFDRFRQLVGV